MSFLTHSQPSAACFAASGLTKRYGPATVLREFSFDIQKGSVVSFVGENGAGKSTLLNILSGIVQPDEGKMTLGSKAYAPNHYGDAIRSGVSRVFQEQFLIPSIPVYENLTLGYERRFDRSRHFVDRRRMIDVSEKMIAEAGVDIDVRRMTSSYPFARRQVIEIIRACLAPIVIGEVESPLILLDEPTSALDRKDEEVFFNLVKRLSKSASFAFISHRLTEVLSLSDKLYVLKDGQFVTEATPSEITESDLHRFMVGRQRDADYYHEGRQLNLEDNTPSSLTATNLTLTGEYEGVSLTVRAGEILGIGGLLDSGKTALGLGIAGVRTPTAGTVAVAGDDPRSPDIRQLVSQGLGYVPAERLAEGMIGEFSVSWNMTSASGGDLMATPIGFWRGRLERAIAEKFIGELRIANATPSKPCSRLSGGNQQKVVLARWLSRNLKVLILDNPTRGVDAGAKEEIYGLIRGLAESGVGILLITDELLELIGLSNRILVMKGGTVVASVDAPVNAKPTEGELVSLMLSGSAGPQSLKSSILQKDAA